ncbi:hypothetical protein GCM10010245_32460 [Streptomyces spectabilis]|nr:hypothetical protein GCM10010245_32460 [Streptomyces spectabilis]
MKNKATTIHPIPHFLSPEAAPDRSPEPAPLCGYGPASLRDKGMPPADRGQSRVEEVQRFGGG